MAETLDLATFGIALDDSLFARGSQRVISGLNSLEARAEKAIATVEKIGKALGNIEAIGQKLQSVGLGLTIGITAPLLAMGRAAVESAVKMDAARRALTAVSGSSKEAERQLSRLREVARLPGIDFQGAIEGSTRLQAIGINANTAERALKAFANAIAQTGGGAAQLNSVTVQLGQLASKGKVLAQDLRPIIEAAPVVGKVLSQAFGTIDSETISDKLAKAGKTSKDFINQLIGELEKLPKVAGGAREVIENFEITVRTAFAQIGESILGVIGPALDTAGNYIEAFGNKFAALPDVMKSSIVVMGLVAAAIGPVVAGLGLLLTLVPQVVSGWATLTAALAAGGALSSTLAVLSGFAPVIIGVTAVLGVATAAWLNYKTATEQAASIGTDALKDQVNQAQKFEDLAKATKLVADSQLDASAQGRALQTVLLDLDPATRNYITAIEDQQEKTKQLAQIIQNDLLSSQNILSAQLAVVASALEEQADKIKNSEESVRNLTNQVNNGKEAFELYAIEYGGVTEASRLTREETLRLGKAIEDAKKSSADAKDQTSELGGKVFALSEQLKKAGKSFEDQARAAGLSETQINLLQSAMQAYIANQGKAGSATAATTNRISEQEEAVRNLANAVNSLDVSGIQSGIKAKLEQIRTQALKEGTGVKGALSLLEKERRANLPGSNVTLGDAIGKQNQADAIQRALSESVSPKPKSASSIRAAARKEERDARQLAEAKAQTVEDGLQRELTAYRKYATFELQVAESLKDRGFLTLKDYFALRLQLTEEGIQKELDVVENGIKYQQGLYTKAKSGSLAQVQATNKVNELLGQQLELYKDLTREQRLNADEYRKQYAALFNQPLDLSNQEKIAGTKTNPNLNNLPDVYVRAQERLKQLQATQKQVYADTYSTLTVLNDAGQEFNRTTLLDQELRRQQLIVQQQVYTGVLTETEGRKQLLAVQRQFRDALLETLKADLARAEANQQFDKALDLRQQIQELQTFGQELNNTQRFLKGLGNTLDAGDIFEGLGGGLRDVLRQGFEDGFDKAGDSFLKLLKRMAAELLTSQVVKILRDLFNPKSSAGGGASGGNVLQPSGGSAGGGNPLTQILGSLSGGGGSSSYGGFATPGYAGGPGAGAYGGGGSGGGGGFSLGGFNLGGLKGIVSKIPIIGRLFGGGAGSLPSLGKVGANGLPLLNGKFVPPELTGGAINGINVNGTVAGASAAPSALASAGAGGLLLGGGLLGSLAGGNSQVGKLLGGIGGTLGAGALGATGIFGGGLAAALPALFSNPITAIIAGALIGGALLARWIGGRDMRAFQKASEQTYGVKVKGDQTGQALFKSVKEIGEQAFGKGNFRKKIDEIVKIDDVKSLIGSYAETTGQSSSKLAKDAAMMREIQDPAASINRFTKRAFGGGVSAGVPVVVGDAGKPEIFVPQMDGMVYPSTNGFQADLTERMYAVMGGAFRVVIERLAGMHAVAVNAANSSPSGTSQTEIVNALRMNAQAMMEMRDAAANLAGIPPEHLIAQTLPQMRREIGGEVRNALNEDGRLRADVANQVFGN